MQLNPSIKNSNKFTNIKMSSTQDLTLNQVLFGQKPKPNTLVNVIDKYNPTNNLIFEQKTIGNNQNDNLVSNSESFENSENKIQNDNSSYSTELAKTNMSGMSGMSDTSDTSNASDTSDMSTSNSDSEPSEENLSETKLYWEFGNTGLKIKNFNKKMSKNLAVMYYIDRIFCEYNENNKVFNYSELFNTQKNLEFKLNTGTLLTVNSVVFVNINHKKITGNYKVLEAGFINLSNIKIKKRDLKNNQIPSLKSSLAHKENLIHLLKIIKIFNLQDKMTIDSNFSNGNNDFLLPLEKLEKDKIFKSNKKSGFYIKVYNDHTKGFVCHNDSIYYFASNIDLKSGEINFRYYKFELQKGLINKIENI
jgi:hypothetical protein